MTLKNPFRHHREIFIATLLTAGIFVAALVMSSFNFLGTPHEIVGKEAPEIHFMDFDRKETRLSEKRGTVILIYFWAVWCRDCLSELPLLAELEQHFESKGFLLLAFDLSGRGDKIKGTLTGGQLPRNLIFNFSKKNLGPYKMKGMPLAVLIDERGLVRKVFTGPTKWMSLATIREIEGLFP